MAFLTEFLTLLSPTAQKEAALASPEFEEWKELGDHCDIMVRRGYFTAKRDKLSDPEKLVLKKEERLLSTIWKKYQFVPEEMEDSALRERDHWTWWSENRLGKALAKFSRYPQVKLNEIRDAADKLSLMVLPLRYLDTVRMKSILEEIGHTSIRVREIKDLISCIAQYTEQDLYVLCPVNLYDLVQVEKDIEQREVIFGGELVRVKALLDTIMQIQRNLFAILRGNEADTGIWEIGEGGECSENELMHLKILVETIVPIQHSLLKIIQMSSKDVEQWEKEMRVNHCKEVSQILQKMSQQLSWSEEAKKALERSYPISDKYLQKASWAMPEAATLPSILFFSLPHGASLMYSDGLAKVLDCYGVDMPESFYLNRGFIKQQREEDAYELEETEITVSFQHD